MNTIKKSIEDLIDDLLNEDDYFEISKNWKTYYFNGYPVPRVSEILSKIIHEEFLLQWANSLGYKRKSYTKERDSSAMKGTYTHELIEQFLHSKYVKTDFNDIPTEHRFAVYNAYNSFISWYNMVNENMPFRVLETEKQLVCPYFGGTLDCLAEIDGRIYIIDFKTSNHITYKYFLQLAAYKYMIENYYNIPITGGVLILWLNKKDIQYKDYVLDMNNIEHRNIMDQNTNTFLSLVYSYYNINRSQDLFNNEFKGRIV